MDYIIPTTSVLEERTSTTKLPDTVGTSVGLISALILLIIIIIIIVCRCKHAKRRRNSDVSQNTDPSASNSVCQDPGGAGGYVSMVVTGDKMAGDDVLVFSDHYWSAINPEVRSLAKQVLIDREDITIGKVLGKGELITGGRYGYTNSTYNNVSPLKHISAYITLLYHNMALLCYWFLTLTFGHHVVVI